MARVGRDYWAIAPRPVAIGMRMTYDKTQWVAAIQKAVTDLKTDKPTAGLPTAIAGVKYLRDRLVAAVSVDIKAGHKKGDTAEDVTHLVVDCIKEECKLLLKDLMTNGVNDGFLSNASAAAKAAGFKGAEEHKLTADELERLTD